MNSLADRLNAIRRTLPDHVTLVAVSKTKPIEALREAYDAGQRDFGENKIQELVQKQPLLPPDVRWHMIGHVQTNKIKYIAPFVHLIHGIDRLKVLQEINKRAGMEGRIIDGLLQVHIAQEPEKFGFDSEEIHSIAPNLAQEFPFVRIRGLMGMATFTSDDAQIKTEFNGLRDLYESCKAAHKLSWDTLSMGMSGDYELAIEAGSTMVRVGSAIFGERTP